MSTVVMQPPPLRRVSTDQEPELFWAIRGAGANFGIVTTFEFDAAPPRSWHTVRSRSHRQTFPASSNSGDRPWNRRRERSPPSSTSADRSRRRPSFTPDRTPTRPTRPWHQKFSITAVTHAPHAALDPAGEPVHEYIDRMYPNFESDHGPSSVSEAFPEPTFTRLRALKTRWDPDQIFIQNFDLTATRAGAPPPTGFPSHRTSRRHFRKRSRRWPRSWRFLPLGFVTTTLGPRHDNYMRTWHGRRTRHSNRRGEPHSP